MLLDPVERYRAKLHEVPEALAHHGLALVAGLTSSADLADLAQTIGHVVQHRDSDPDGITTITDHNIEQPGFNGFTNRTLEPHTDRSSIPHPPGLLLTSCGQPATSGGDCVLVDGQAIHDDLTTTAPKALNALRTPRSALFGGAAGHLGSIFTGTTDSHIAIRLRLDDLARFSPDVSRQLPTLQAAIDRHAITVKLRPGEGYILNNHRWLHGRHAFTGHRVLFRITANPHPHLNIPPGFHPAKRREALNNSPQPTATTGR
jgi:alpha-ketoglutarate-dependent taurine dioxygenase